MEAQDKIKFRNEMTMRLKSFVIDLIKFCQTLPNTDESRVIKRQLLRSGSSVYANYRAANRSRSKAEFFSKISIVVEEADETEMWLDLLFDAKITQSAQLKTLLSESLEILKIMATIRKNIKSNN